MEPDILEGESQSHSAGGGVTVLPKTDVRLVYLDGNDINEMARHVLN